MKADKSKRVHKPQKAGGAADAGDAEGARRLWEIRVDGAAKRRRRRGGAWNAPARDRGFSPGNSRRHDTRHAWVWSPSHCLHETVRRERCGAERLDEQHGGCFLGNPPGKVRGDAERKRGVETNTSAFGAVAPCVKKSTLRLTRATRSCQAATH